jgi:mannose-6-phosphate isomerase-like protein (cupin superfamily)
MVIAEITRHHTHYEQEDGFMKNLIILAIGIGMGVVLAAQTPAMPVIYVDAEKVAQAIAQTGLLANNPEFMVAGAQRHKPGEVEVHEKTTDIVFVQAGEATYVTGGKMVGGRQTRPGEWLGTGIEGGTEHRLKKGDVIIVPAGQPHWFKEVPKEINHYMVRVHRP